MPYTVEISRQARQKLQSLARRDRLRITDKVMQLGLNPDDPTLDVKPLVGSALFRLRVGGWRVLFLRLRELRVIRIEKIGSRGDVYK